MKRCFIFIVSCLLTSLCYAGPGGYLNISNISTYTMVKDPNSQIIYRMNSWDLPKRLYPTEQYTGYVEFNANIFLNVFSDHAETTYTVECPNKQLEQITISAQVDKLDVPNFHYNVKPEYKATVSSLNCVTVHVSNFTTSPSAEWLIPFVDGGTVKIYILNYPS